MLGDINQTQSTVNTDRFVYQQLHALTTTSINGIFTLTLVQVQR
jgi:hypothetical protein